MREQVEFNRGAMQCVQASIEALAEMNRALAAIARQHQAWQAETVNAHREEMMTLSREATELKDVRKHWLNGASALSRITTITRSTCCARFRNCRPRFSIA